MNKSFNMNRNLHPVLLRIEAEDLQKKERNVSKRFLKNEISFKTIQNLQPSSKNRFAKPTKREETLVKRFLKKEQKFRNDPKLTPIIQELICETYKKRRRNVSKTFLKE